MNNTKDLYEVVEFLTTINPPRNYANIASLNKAADFIANKFASYGLKHSFQNYAVKSREYKNVIGIINEHIEKRIIIGAHYDVFGEMPGADDNASAVAGVLECAKELSKIKDNLNIRVDFVLFSLEEPPYFYSRQMGSYVHAKSQLFDKQNIELMINFEMIGYFTDEPNSQDYPLGLMKIIYPNTGDFIAIISNEASCQYAADINYYMQNHIKSISVALPDHLSAITRSDHLNYWNLGYNAIMLTDTADYRNPNYHKTTDTIDTLDFDAIKKICNGVCDWLILKYRNLSA